MKKITKILLFTAMLTMLFSAATAFGASSSSSGQKAVKARAVKFMKAAKNYQIKKMGQNIVKSATYSYIPDPAGNAVQHMNKKHLKYKVGKISVSGTKASVRVKVTYFDGYSVFKKSFNDTIRWYAVNRKATTEQVQKKMYSFAMANYRNVSKSKYMKSTTLILKMNQYSNGWFITSITGSYGAAINGNYQKAYKAVFKK